MGEAISHSEQGVTVTVGDFYTAGRDRLELGLLVGGKGLDRVIGEPVTNRPGLALTGFYEHFASRRIQVIGKAESAYLDSLGPAVAHDRIVALIDHGIHSLVFTGGMKPSAEIISLADRCGVAVFVSPMKTRHFAHLSAFILEALAAPKTALYGTMIEVSGLGVLIQGDPGLGKSETALGLIKRGHALIADDLTRIRKDVAVNLLYGSASGSTRGYMEIRGIGIIDVAKIFGVNAVRGEKRLQLVVSFRRLSDIVGEIDRVGQNRRVKTILGVEVPEVVIPVSEGRDLVNLVETAAQQQKLVSQGVDIVDELSERLKSRAEQNLK